MRQRGLRGLSSGAVSSRRPSVVESGSTVASMVEVVVAAAAVELTGVGRAVTATAAVRPADRRRRRRQTPSQRTTPTDGVDCDARHRPHIGRLSQKAWSTRRRR